MDKPIAMNRRVPTRVRIEFEEQIIILDAEEISLEAGEIEKHAGDGIVRPVKSSGEFTLKISGRMPKPGGVYPERARSQESSVASFVEDAVAICKRHKAEFFPRTDGKRQILSVMLGEVWLDFKRISGDGATRLEE